MRCNKLLKGAGHNMNVNKSAAILLTCIVTFVLGSCSFLSHNLIPQKVKVDNTEYRTGFYGDLLPQNLKLIGDSFTVNGIKYSHVENSTLDLIHSDVGLDDCGVLYCNSKQWNDAKAYYSDPENYLFYCRIDNGVLEKSVEIDDFDAEVFDSLFSFASKNNYDPLDSKHNEKIERLHIPIPDFKTNPALTFYKTSIDGNFTSFQGYTFHIIDEKMYFLFYYDYGHGEYEEMQCTVVPDDISQYIINLLKRHSIEFDK